jgi:GMP synthase-like glutamine amidotransferase
LIASTHGARVYRYVNETGWCPVHRVPDAGRAFATFLESFHVFPMHHDTFEIPYSGRLLCSGEIVKNQAFRLKSALGLQFHLEMTAPLIADWIKDLNKPRQDQILRDSGQCLDKSNTLCRNVIEDFLGITGTQLMNK